MTAHKNLILIIVGIFTLISSSIAGSRGYYIQISDTSKNQIFNKLFTEYRKSEHSSNLSECWKKRQGEGISAAYIKSQPIKFTKAELKTMLSNDSKKLIHIGKRLSTFTDDQISNGFDGALIFQINSNTQTLTSISRDGKKINLFPSLSSKTSMKEFSNILCQASSGFDSTFSP